MHGQPIIKITCTVASCSLLSYVYHDARIHERQGFKTFKINMCFQRHLFCPFFARVADAVFRLQNSQD
jgi:hypothetical protein